MPYANGSERRVAYVPETTFGTTPTTPSFKLLRITGGALRTQKSTTVSDEIRPDRNVTDVLMTAQDVVGGYDFEFSSDSFDDLLQAVLRGTWTSNVLKNGTVARSFFFEEMSPLGAASAFSRFSGVVPNTLNLNFPSRGLITGSVGMMGRQETPGAVIITGATYATTGTTQPATSSANIGGITVTGVTTPYRMRSLELTISNDLRIRDELGSLYSDVFGAGRCAVSGRILTYFESHDQYQAFLAHSSGGISMTFGVEANKRYTLSLPNFRTLDAERQPGTNSSDFMLNLPFQAVFDPTEAASIKITRAIA